MATNLTAADFKTKIFDYDKEQDWKYTGALPCVIDFYADWCGPCKMVAPILEELTTEYKGRIEIYKVNTEIEEELASVFGIKSIPSILFVPVTGMPQMSSGALPKTGFVQAFKDIFNIELQQ